MSSGFNKLHACLKCVDKSGAGGGNVKSPSAFASDFVLDKARGGRKEHVRSDSCHYDSFNLSGRDAPFLQELLDGFRGEVRSGDAFIDDVTLTYAGTLQDPVISGVNHFFQVLIGQQARRQKSPQSSDLRLMQHLQIVTPGRWGCFLSWLAAYEKIRI